jgi:hypothetical protein
VEKENIKYGIAATAVVVASIGAILYFSYRKPDAPAKPAAAAPPVTPAPPAAEEPAIRYPVTAAPATEPLPPLNESDQPLVSALGGLIGTGPVEQFVVTENVVRKIVVTIDNLPTTRAAERLRPLKPVPGRFATSGPEDALTLDPANYERYAPLIQLVRSTDDDKLIAFYVRHYPLFQEAYENLGHPPQYFNDRLIEVIDHLLATPDLKDPIALAQPNVQFEYADPAIERRSAGQKVLIRMGSANAAAVKQKLRSLRAKLVERPPVN